tara:strand:+ start:189 stop:1697 length:1509 start_codon:yes stop_codon:yes gene_type:complete
MLPKRSTNSSGAGQSAASKPAVPSLSEPRSSGGLRPAAPKPAVTSGIQSSGDSHPAVSHLVRTLVEEVLAWQGRNGVQRIPSKYRDDCEERNLAVRFAKVLLRRDKALGTEPSRSQLSLSEVALVNSVSGVPLHGCSATASCSSSVAQQLPEPAAKQGPRHAADTTDINFEHCQEFLERQQEHIETLKSMLPDVKTRPSDSRIRELAERLKVPEQVDRQLLPLNLVFKRVQQQFHDEVCELQSKSRTMSSTNPAAKKARVATAVAGSGGPHPAAPSNRVDEVESSSNGVAQSAAAKQLPSHAGRVLHTGSSDVAQLAATCQEPRSTMLFMKILEPIWAIEVADGQKMFECVANKTKWQNQFKQLASGDLITIVMKGRDKVSAVCEVASAATVKETNRDVLKSKLQESRHEALDAYLDGAESFDYVEFKHVFDCRCVLSESSTAAFLERVGLALPKTPLVGLLRPVVIDAQWHSRLHEYMQQAVLRLPVSLATASGRHREQIA